MYSADKKQLLKDFAEAVSVPVGLTDDAKWPVRAGTVIFPVRNILVREFLEQIKQTGLLGYADKWRAAFDSPTQLWRMSHHLINGLLDDEVDKGEIAQTILIFLEGIAALTHNNYFERIGKHLIFTPEMLTDALNVDISMDKKQARKALMLSGLIWAYSETNYFVAHELTCEYHGPYLLEDGTYAVVREFMNMTPSDLWENRDYAGIPERLRVITIHDASLSIGFDAYNNLFDEKGSMAPSIISAAVLWDDKSRSIDEIDALIALLSEKVPTFTDEADAMDKTELARKYMDVFWYRKKSLTDYIGTSWKPSSELYTVLEDGLAKGPIKKPGVVVIGRGTPEELAPQFDFSAYI